MSQGLEVRFYTLVVNMWNTDALNVGIKNLNEVLEKLVKVQEDRMKEMWTQLEVFLCTRRCGCQYCGHAADKEESHRGRTERRDDSQQEYYRSSAERNDPGELEYYRGGIEKGRDEG